MEVTMDILATAKKIVKTLDLKRASDITLLKIEELTVLSDYFVIASASSTTQLKSLAGEVEFELDQDGIKPLHIEGYDSDSWILLDYGSIVVHLFLKDSRMFYSLERLWSDAEVVDITDLIEEE